MQGRANLFVLTTILFLSTASCMKKVMVDGQIEAFRRASTSADTIADYDVGRAAAASALAQFEGMHALSPENPDALFLLTKTWTGYGFGFVEDDLEAAQDAGDDDAVEFQRRRARQAYDRAVLYGLELLSLRDGGFAGARRSQSTLVAWLAANFRQKEDAYPLLWVGSAWLARAALMAGDDAEGAAFVAELFVGVSLLERAVALDASAEHYAGLVALGQYHARSNLAEMDEGKRLFNLALRKTARASLLVQLAYATRYACAKGDARLYQAMLGEVIKGQDSDPQEGLENAIARRRALRWFTPRRAKEQCGIALLADLSAARPHVSEGEMPGHPLPPALAALHDTPPVPE